MMEIKSIRKYYTTESTISEVFVDGEFFCYALEDVDRFLEKGGDKVYGETAIPRGKYQVIINMSQRFNKRMMQLINVPQFTGVRVHAGNTAADTDGCLLLGKSMENNRVMESRDAVDALQAMAQADLLQGRFVTWEVV